MNGTILGIDLETASGCDLKTHGAWAYSLHESTKVYCVVFGFATARGEPYRYVRWEPGQPFPGEVRFWIMGGKPVLAHNAAFEAAIWTNVLGGMAARQIAAGGCVVFGDMVPDIDHDQWHDTQPLGLAVNLPASLDGLAHSLGCPVQKDLEGSKVMISMATLTIDELTGEWDNVNNTVENRLRLADYCETDVGAMLDCWYRLPPLSVTEAAVLRVDRDINRRGVYLDQEFAAACARMSEERKGELDSEAFSLTAGELADSRAAPALKRWLADQWVFPPKVARRKKQDDGTFKTTLSETVDKNAVNGMLDDPTLAAEVRAVLLNRMESNKVTSLAKLKRVPLMVDAAGRLRNALSYCGAHTGRWTSYGLQIHNLAKDKLGPGQGSLVRLAIARGDLDLLKFAVDQPLDAISQSIRSCVAAPPGRELIAADFSAIEARVVAWLAGQNDMLRLFENGTDVYVYQAGKAGAACPHLWRKDCSACEKNRQLGKVMVLALGYGMGALKFLDTASKWGVQLEPKEARRLQKAWRKSNDRIVSFWHELEGACRDAIRNVGETFSVGLIRCVATKSCLFVRLPSGRALRYWRPRIVSGGTKIVKTLNDEGELIDFEMHIDEIRYHRPKGAAMMADSAYGGQLVENVTQAVARDLLAEASIRIDAVEPYDLVMHVHDSLAAEVPTGRGDVDEFCDLMNASPTWADGLPLATEGYRDTRFRG